ncbi:unnamed protein product [Nippostrongylus brasiliensis]|uniref:Intraflagellar transport protein 43 homolog n=1 Tax=Nippostrongylus brasiliensis TaxID=27835 RepID=A0A0N4YQ13_NIPBR|nr:unnamed protein product [Nippostrongylus brasiliensis]
MYDLVELRNSQRVKKSGQAKTQTMSVEQPAQPGGAAGAAAPKAIQAGKFSSEEEDSLNEDDFAEPTAENYMANITDIEYTHEEDYFFTVDLPELEKQPHYSWQSLQANTFLSNVLCLPTEKEKETGSSTKDK